MGVLKPIRTALYLAGMQVRRRYIGSTLGILWSMVNPVMRILVLFMVFTYIFPNRIPHFLAYLFFGILGWDCVTSSLNSSSNSLAARSSVLACCTIPRFTFVLIDVFTEFFCFLFALAAAMIYVYTTDMTPPWTIALLPIVLIPLLIFNVGCGLAIAHASARFRDLGHIVNIMLQFGFWFTPLAYKLDNAPVPMLLAAEMNPIWWMLKPIRAVLYEGVIPEPMSYGLALTFAVFMLMVGIKAERSLGPTTILYVSS